MDWFKENISEEIGAKIIRLKVWLDDDNAVERDFRPDLIIDYEKLEEAMQTAPQAYAFWAMVYSEAKSEVAKLELMSKRRRAAIIDMLMGEAKKEGSLRIPEKIVRELAEKDEKLVLTESKLVIANRTAGKLFHIVEAMKMKAEMLRSLAGFKREELRNP